MLFNTLTYLLFLPIVFVLYWCARNARQQNIVLLIASMVFYGWWSVEHLILMIATCLFNYTMLQCIQNYKHKRLWLTVTLLTNFSVLGVFKYYNFFAENFVEAMSLAGVELDFPTINLILPVGISFYIFQLSGYAIDIFRSPRREELSIINYFTFITFFPQLVAGPIERGHDMMPQIRHQRHFNFDTAREGMKLILWGLVKKMLLADNCASAADYIFANYTTASLPDLWLGALFFTLQIYGDFSGYSDIAVGSARLLGINIHNNFNKPYFARNIQDFWRRWHITLMTWFKDYVYIPMGGNRKGTLRKQCNIFTVFLLSGLWHGANWTFVCWGLYHALWFIIPHKWLTFIIVMVGWVIFRSPDMAVASQYIEGMFSPSLWGPTTCSRMPLLIILLFALAEWLSRKKEHPFNFKSTGWMSHQWVRMSIYLLIFLSVIFLGGKQIQFIYFQF